MTVGKSSSSSWDISSRKTPDIGEMGWDWHLWGKWCLFAMLKTQLFERIASFQSNLPPEGNKSRITGKKFKIKETPALFEWHWRRECRDLPWVSIKTVELTKGSFKPWEIKQMFVHKPVSQGFLSRISLCVILIYALYILGKLPECCGKIDSSPCKSPLPQHIVVFHFSPTHCLGTNSKVSNALKVSVARGKTVK